MTRGCSACRRAITSLAPLLAFGVLAAAQIGDGEREVQQRAARLGQGLERQFVAGQSVRGPGSTSRLRVASQCHVVVEAVSALVHSLCDAAPCAHAPIEEDGRFVVRGVGKGGVRLDGTAVGFADAATAAWTCANPARPRPRGDRGRARMVGRPKSSAARPPPPPTGTGGTSNSMRP